MKSTKVGLAVALVATAAVASSCFWDVDSNNKLVIACIGDSNTALGYATWCHDLQRAYGGTAVKGPDGSYTIPNDTGIRVASYARSGSTASCTYPNGSTAALCADDEEDAQGQLLAALSGTARPGVNKNQLTDAAWTWPEDKAVAPRADTVVIASGSNDILANKTADETLASILLVKTLAESQLPNRVFVATIPPLWRITPSPANQLIQDCTDWIGDDGVNKSERIRALNTLLRQQVPADRLLDFDTGFDCSNYTVEGTTGLHMNGLGNTLRALRGAQLLERERQKWLANPT